MIQIRSQQIYMGEHSLKMFLSHIYTDGGQLLISVAISAWNQSMSDQTMYQEVEHTTERIMDMLGISDSWRQVSLQANSHLKKYLLRDAYDELRSGAIKNVYNTMVYFDKKDMFEKYIKRENENIKTKYMKIFTDMSFQAIIGHRKIIF
ncbi:hypothetical protein MK079_04725 [Candidatus Gracilibacteria bacterium]|nr:hypothetical protein [Candidatus Gracilibacteria bacterium]